MIVVITTSFIAVPIGGGLNDRLEVMVQRASLSLRHRTSNKATPSSLRPSVAAVSGGNHKNADGSSQVRR